jgi:cold shock CspA family protein
MGKSQETFQKKEKEKKKAKKKKEKQARREERKAAGTQDFDDMIAYVDENGMIVDTPPDPAKKEKVKAEDIVLGIPPKNEEDIDPVHHGKVEFFDTSKGFGFIRDTETNEKHFVHVTGLIDEISENDKVSFELEQGKKGMDAVKVKKD